jgi:hypothetical protein
MSATGAARLALRLARGQAARAGIATHEPEAQLGVAPGDVVTALVRR